MNRESMPEAVLGITLGLLVVVLVAYRGKDQPSLAVLRRGGMLMLLGYAVLAAPIFVRGGMTLVGLLGVLVAMCLPVAAMVLVLDRGTPPPALPEKAARAVVGTAVAAAMLIAAGQTLAMLGRVDPRMVVVVLAVVVTLVVVGDGLAASGRVGSTAMWLMIVPIGLALALGVFLGGIAPVGSPIIEVDGPTIPQVVGIAAALFVIGWADNGLLTLNRAALWSPLRALGGAVVVVVLVFLGQLMFFGGAILAPSLQFFVVPANLDLLPGLLGVVLAVLAVVFAALVAGEISGVGALGGQDRWAVNPGWAVGAAAVATAVALVDPTFYRVVVVGSLAGAALVGAMLSGGDSSRGVAIGLAAAGVCVLVLALTDRLTLDWPSTIATVLVCVAGFIGARRPAAVVAART